MARPTPCKDYVRTPTGKWMLKGEEILEALQKKLDNLRIPPAWKNVVVATDPTAKIVAVGQDAVGRWQYKYSQKWIKQRSKNIFDRIKSFSRDISGMRRQMEADVNIGDIRAMLLMLEDKTAMRVGSLVDTKAKVKAYGLTTLKNEHLIVEGNRIILDFVAKKGVKAHYELTDKVLASFLKERKAATKVGEYLFPEVNGKILNKYIRSLSKKSYSIKDYRTYHATRIALEELRIYSGRVLTSVERNRIVNTVSEKVSKFLHNSPTMARNSYIDPSVWETIGGLPKKGFTTKKIAKGLRKVKSLEAELIEASKGIEKVRGRDIPGFLDFLNRVVSNDKILDDPTASTLSEVKASVDLLEQLELISIEGKYILSKAKSLFTTRQIRAVQKVIGSVL